MHAVHIVHEMVRAQTYQPVVCLRVLFVHKVTVVRADDLHVVFARQVYEYRVHLFLPLVDFHIRVRFLRLMALELDIIVVPEEVLKPLNGLLRLREIAAFRNSLQYLLRQLASETSRTADDAFVPFLE